MRNAIMTLILSLAGLAGCGDQNSPPADAERDGAFDSLTESVQEAEDLEEAVLDKKREMDEALKRMEGDSPPQA